MRYFLVVPTFAVFCFLTVPGCQSKPENRAEIEQAEQKVSELLADLDARRTESGAHERVPADEIKDEDPWGTTYKISYSQSPKSDVVTVRSAGPDRVFNTDDDLVAKSTDAAGEAPVADASETKTPDKSASKREAATGSKEVAKADKKKPTSVKKTPEKSGNGGTATPAKPKGAGTRETVRDTLTPRKSADDKSSEPATAATEDVIACGCECASESGCRIVRRILSRRRPAEWVVHWEVEE